MNSAELQNKLFLLSAKFAAQVAQLETDATEIA